MIQIILYKHSNGKYCVGVQVDSPLYHSNTHLLIYEEITKEVFDAHIRVATEMEETYKVDLEEDKYENKKYTITPIFIKV